MYFLEDKFHISVDESYLEPRLRVFSKIEYKPLHAPIFFHIKLKIDGKIISEYTANFDTNFGIEQHANFDMVEYKEFSFNSYFFINKLAIQAIERHRLNRSDKSVSFEMDLSMNAIFNGVEIKNFKTSSTLNRIEQSSWVNNFSSKLGIGDFILLELHQPNKTKFAKAISDMPSDSELKVFLENALDGAYKQMKKAKDFMQEGKWSDSILALRPVIETFKTGSNRNNVTVELKEYYERSVETDNGWEQFRDLIQNSFDYASKYIHVLGQGANRNNSQVIPVAREEDAYFVYNLCLSTLYWIKRKIER